MTTDLLAEIAEGREQESSKPRADAEAVLVASRSIYTGQPELSHPPRVVDLADLIARADQHIALAKDGTATATKSLHNDLEPEEVAHVATLLDIFNTQPIQHLMLKLPPVEAPDDTASTGQAVGGGAPVPCTPHIKISNKGWWGIELYLDHCFCSEVSILTGGAAVGAAVVFEIIKEAFGVAVFGALGGVWIALISATIAAYVAMIVKADTYCTPNAGCKLVFTWFAPAFIRTMC